MIDDVDMYVKAYDKEQDLLGEYGDLTLLSWSYKLKNLLLKLLT